MYLQCVMKCCELAFDFGKKNQNPNVTKSDCFIEIVSSTCSQILNKTGSVKHREMHFVFKRQQHMKCMETDKTEHSRTQSAERKHRHLKIAHAEKTPKHYERL